MRVAALAGRDWGPGSRRRRLTIEYGEFKHANAAAEIESVVLLGPSDPRRAVRRVTGAPRGRICGFSVAVCAGNPCRPLAKTLRKGGMIDGRRPKFMPNPAGRAFRLSIKALLSSSQLNFFEEVVLFYSVPFHWT
jgi:hypothetical protein